MKNLLRFVFVLLLVILSSGQAIAQQAAAPPLKPANDAPANTEVLKLLKAGMPESVVLSKIHAITEKFDTSADALVALKLAGASEAELTAILAPQGASSAESKPASAPANSASTTSGPTLAEAMKFIQDQLSDLGNVAFVTFLHDTNTDATGTATYTNEYSNVVADPGQCRITYHRKATNSAQPGKNETYVDTDKVFSLREVENVVVSPYVQSINSWSAKQGQPNIVVTSSNPSITELSVRRPHGEEDFFYFTDNDLAIRVAKAFARAVKLCGGGNKDPF